MTSKALLRHALRWATGELAARQPAISSARVLPWAASARLEAGGIGYWVKVGPPDSSAVEQRILAVAGALGLPVPALVAANAELSAVVTREVLATGRRATRAEVMEACERIHTTLAAHLDKLDLSLLTASSCALTCIAHRSGWIDQAAERHLAAAFDAHAAELDALDRSLVGPTGVVHGDLHPANVVTSASGPVFIDWADARSGARAWDLAAYGQAVDGAPRLLASLKEVADFLSTPPPVAGETYSLSIPKLRVHIRRRIAVLVRLLHDHDAGA
jgi:hypothetical protein